MGIVPVPAGGRQLAYDPGSLARLRHDGDATHAAAQQFEALFIQHMLGSMRKTVTRSGLLGDAQTEKLFQEMADAQWAQELAQRGLGLADFVERQLAARAPATPATATAHTAATAGADLPFARATPEPLAASDTLAAISAQRQAAGAARSAPLIDLNGGAPLFAGRSDPPAREAASQAARAAPDPVSERVRSFVRRMQGPALQAAQSIGVSAQLILAQAALESGWGQREITNDGGQTSFNVFGIKATGWNGASTVTATREHSGGALRRVQAGFRVYESYEQAFADYARLIGTAPRYAPVREADSAEAAARALQDSGYATDPNYADKLIAIMRMMPEPDAAAVAQRDVAPLIDLAAASGTPLI